MPVFADAESAALLPLAARVAASEGFFRAADGGTLLLDEIAEMPIGLQAKLLRVLQEGEVAPIGATSLVKVDVRIIAAANPDLPTKIAEGRLRADLFTTIYDQAENCIRQGMLKFDHDQIAAMLGDLEDIRIAFRPG